MAGTIRLGIVSDIHYAGCAERARGDDYELCGVANPLLRLFLRLFRHFVWLRSPLNQGHLLDHFLAEGESLDFVVANGDYSCNTGFVGVSDEAAFRSVEECLGKIRGRFGERCRAVFGDHELGKKSFIGGQGGMRLASWRKARRELKLEGFWEVELGRYTLMGVASSLVALPVYIADTLPRERAGWEEIRAEHMEEIRRAFRGLDARQRVLLFCHDPTALPFLLREDAVRSRLAQMEQTVIGHLHSNLVFWNSRLLAGIPEMRFLGHSLKRMNAALHEARDWRPFHVRLCPALAGIELLKDGGFLRAECDPEGRVPVRFEKRRVPRKAIAG